MPTVRSEPMDTMDTSTVRCQYFPINVVMPLWRNEMAISSHICRGTEPPPPPLAGPLTPPQVTTWHQSKNPQDGSRMQCQRKRTRVKAANREPTLSRDAHRKVHRAPLVPAPRRVGSAWQDPRLPALAVVPRRRGVPRQSVRVRDPVDRQSESVTLVPRRNAGTATRG